MHEIRALADINLSGVPLAEALEAFICRRDPNLENVQVKRATPTGDIEARVEPNKRWYEVIYDADDDDDDDDDDDEDEYKYRTNSEITSKGKAKGRRKST